MVHLTARSIFLSMFDITICKLAISFCLSKAVASKSQYQTRQAAFGVPPAAVQVSGVRCQQTDDRVRNLMMGDVIAFVFLTPDTRHLKPLLEESPPHWPLNFFIEKYAV